MTFGASHEPRTYRRYRTHRGEKRLEICEQNNSGRREISLERQMERMLDELYGGDITAFASEAIAVLAVTTLRRKRERRG